MIENDLLIKFFEVGKLRVHLKKPTAF